VSNKACAQKLTVGQSTVEKTHCRRRIVNLHADINK